MVKYSVGSIRKGAGGKPNKKPNKKALVIQARAILKNRSAQLDGLFYALSDPIRRAVVTELAPRPYNPVSISRLAEPFGISMPAFLKHIKILEENRLIRRTKIGRTVYCRPYPQTLGVIDSWVRITLEISSRF